MNWYHIEKSALITFIGIILLFSTAILVVLIAPRHIDPTWTEATSPYQVQMYEIADPNIYIGNASHEGGYDLQFVYHLQEGLTLLAFEESEILRIIAPQVLEKYITKYQEKPLKLTSKILMLRKPENEMIAKASELNSNLQQEWKTQHDNEEIPTFQIYELYSISNPTAFSLGSPNTIIHDWVDKDFLIIDQDKKAVPYHFDEGVIYVKNPIEYKIVLHNFAGQTSWRYNPNGDAIESLAELREKLKFWSRKELIEYGEHLYNIEGCWYCHTDQTRTLIQDTILNGSDSFPAPPSSANEYIYQNVTFPGTRRIGPDLSRVGIKKSSRDWHKGHFWSPKTASKGSVMPAFQHFFDSDPRGTLKNLSGVPNYKFEAMYQYLMTKGSRITPPNQGWWIGKDPINTTAIIEGRKK